MGNNLQSELQHWPPKHIDGMTPMNDPLFGFEEGRAIRSEWGRHRVLVVRTRTYASCYEVHKIHVVKFTIVLSAVSHCLIMFDVFMIIK